MKQSDIKTREDFYKFADIQYQRLHRLRDIWQDETQTQERRQKALELWRVMVGRVLSLNQVAIEISQPKPPANFHSGVTIVAESDKELLFPKRKPFREGG